MQLKKVYCYRENICILRTSMVSRYFRVLDFSLSSLLLNDINNNQPFNALSLSAPVALIYHHFMYNSIDYSSLVVRKHQISCPSIYRQGDDILLGANIIFSCKSMDSALPDALLFIIPSSHPHVQKEAGRVLRDLKIRK